MTITPTPEGGTVPADTFAVRLAIVRAVQGWNYDQASEATGINKESWRTWEKGIRHCTDQTGVARVIAAATGLSVNWIAFGGSLADAPPPSPRRRRHGAHGRSETTAYKGTASRHLRNRVLTSGYARPHQVTAGKLGHTRRAA